MFAEPVKKIANRPCFLPEETRRANGLGQPVSRELAQSGLPQQSGVVELSQIGPGIAPGGVLGQDGAQYDLQAGCGGPPALRPEMPV